MQRKSHWTVRLMQWTDSKGDSKCTEVLTPQDGARFERAMLRLGWIKK